MPAQQNVQRLVITGIGQSETQEYQAVTGTAGDQIVASAVEGNRTTLTARARRSDLQSVATIARTHADPAVQILAAALARLLEPHGD